MPVYQTRIKTLHFLNEHLPKIYHALFKTEEIWPAHYENQLEDTSLIESSLYKKVNQVREAEKIVGYSLVGPHRDDLCFFIKGREAKGYGSQGQIRGLVIALKILQLELLQTQSKTGTPILLLDDIISELDDKRVMALMEYLVSYPGQLFVTTAEITKVQSLYRLFSSFKIIDLSSKKTQNGTKETLSDLL